MQADGNGHSHARSDTWSASTPPASPSRANLRGWLIGAVATIGITLVGGVAVVAMLDEPPAAGAHVAEASQTMAGLDGEVVSIFLCDGRVCPAISDAQRNALRADLEADPDVGDVAFESKAEAYENFLELFADDPQLLDSVTPDALPESFRVTLTADASTQDFRQRYTRYPSVEAVVPQVAQRSPR